MGCGLDSESGHLVNAHLTALMARARSGQATSTFLYIDGRRRRIRFTKPPLTKAILVSAYLTGRTTFFVVTRLAQALDAEVSDLVERAWRVLHTVVGISSCPTECRSTTRTAVSPSLAGLDFVKTVTADVALVGFPAKRIIGIWALEALHFSPSYITVEIGQSIFCAQILTNKWLRVEFSTGDGGNTAPLQCTLQQTGVQEAPTPIYGNRQTLHVAIAGAVP